MTNNTPICKTCGRQQISFASTGDAITAFHHSVSFCMCLEQTESTVKHDGLLSEPKVSRFIVAYSEVARKRTGIIIEHENSGHYLHFKAKEALNLLAWLEQERASLEQMAKEQES